MKTLPFQKDCVREIEGFGGRALLAADMGLGKTLMTLHYLRRNPDALPAVVVCPASVKYFWEQEALNIGKIRVSVLEGQTPGGNGRCLTPPRLAIVNYDILRFWLDWLRRLKPRTVILDEIQYTANRTKRTAAARSLCRGVPHVIGLSGTPLVNRPMELFNGLKMIRPNVFRSRWSFGHSYCNPKWTPWGYDFKGASNTEELHGLLTETCMIRRRKADVLPELPGKVRRVVPLPMRNEDEYRKADLDFVGWLRRRDSAKANRASRAEALVKAGYLLRLTARLKLKYVVEWVNRFLSSESGEKLILFAIHRKMIEALHRRCAGRSVVIDGSVTGRRRKATVDRFRRDNRVRLLIGNIKAAGVGLDGLQVASNAAFCELPWQPGAVTQAEGRPHRIGTVRTVWIYYLVAHGTIEERLCEILQRKQETLSATLDGGSVEGDLDVFDLLLSKTREMTR